MAVNSIPQKAYCIGCGCQRNATPLNQQTAKASETQCLYH